MFGNMMDMMGKLQEIKEKTDQAKAQLNNVFLEETSADGSVRVIITANREIKSISINDALLQDKEALEDYLILTLNKAIAKATEKNEATLAEVAKQGLPFNF
ncbi:nucleoid-associated protein [Capnocytophaga sp. HP1101]